MPRITCLVFLSLTLLSGCASVSDEGFDYVPEPGTTYAWSELEINDNNSDLPWIPFKEALDAELAAMGLKPADEGEAQLLLMIDFGVVRKTQNNDAIFQVWVAEKFEEGTLRLDILDQKKSERVWGGEKRVRLRTVSRTMGGVRNSWVETDEERDWQVAEAASRLADELATK